MMPLRGLREERRIRMDKVLVKEPIYSLRSPGGAGKCGKNLATTTPGGERALRSCPGLSSCAPLGLLSQRWREDARVPEVHREAEGCFVLQFPRG
jgi:hypothetical protein